MENQAAEPQNYEDVQKSGYLRKHKSMHRRFFVLRAASEHGPARLEYYENEKKFRSKSPVPKKVLNLETCFNINKRADSKNKHMIVLYTRSESFAIAADSEEVQNEWYQAMLDLQGNCKIWKVWYDFCCLFLHQAYPAVGYLFSIHYFGSAILMSLRITGSNCLNNCLIFIYLFYHYRWCVAA